MHAWAVNVAAKACTTLHIGCRAVNRPDSSLALESGIREGGIHRPLLFSPKPKAPLAYLFNLAGMLVYGEGPQGFVSERRGHLHDTCESCHASSSDLHIRDGKQIHYMNRKFIGSRLGKQPPQCRGQCPAYDPLAFVSHGQGFNQYTE